MKILTLGIFLGICGSLFNCVTYQYVTIDSTLPKTNSGEIFFENDTVLVKYNFNGPDCPAVVQVYNKLNVPLYVGWNQSPFILNDGRIITTGEKSFINAEAVSSEFKWSDNTSGSYSQISGVISQPSRLAFIPPKAFITSAPVNLQYSFFNIPDTAFQKKRVRYSGGVRVSRTKHFGRDNSLFRFRGYLTVSTNKELDHPIFLDNQFWVDEIVRTFTSPGQFYFYNGKSDQFYQYQLR